MSYENRKREYDRLVTSGQVPPEVLVKEFGTLKPKDVTVEKPEQPEKPAKKKGKK